MPKNQKERMLFAFLTVLVTVNAYVFYSLFVVNGNTLMTLNQTNTVPLAIAKQGGVYMFGSYLPVWSVILVEFILAYALELFLGSPLSFKLACRLFPPKKTHPVLFETAIISATAAIMCPAMSFLAAFLYYPFYAGFDVVTLFTNWLKLVCFNFPFALLSQLFFIQPLIRTVFKTLFVKKREEKQLQSVA